MLDIDTDEDDYVEYDEDDYVEYDEDDSSHEEAGVFTYDNDDDEVDNTDDDVNTNDQDASAPNEDAGDLTDEPTLACNAISFKVDLVRESNVSEAKTPFGDASKASNHRPQVVPPIVGIVKINGHSAKALFDSGSTADLISASFVDAHRTKAFKLDEPSPLQLAITGSRGKINRACFAKITHGGCQDQNRYFDILNVDRYDVILGTSYQKDHGVILDVSANDVIYKKLPERALFQPKSDKTTAKASSTQHSDSFGNFRDLASASQEFPQDRQNAQAHVTNDAEGTIPVSHFTSAPPHPDARIFYSLE